MDSLTELKKIIQTINGDITPDDIGIFREQVSQLSQQYEEAPTVTSFLKMMGSLGNHLDSKKTDTHSDLIPTLNSIVKQLDIIINNPDLEKEEINRILSAEIKKFKGLQNKIASKPTIKENDMNNLKAVILAIDWEISETTLQNFEKVVTDLLPKLKTYKIHYTFLKIIHSTGKYIGNQKANAHEDSISFLRSVLENFEYIVKFPDMTFKDKKQVLEADIKRFEKFKRKIARSRRKNRIKNEAYKDEDIQPALTHIKKTSINDAMDNVIPLTSLPKLEDKGALAQDKSDSEKIEPAFANKKLSPDAQKGVMDNIFSVKDSAADELLDAIHLLDFQGSDQNQGQNVLVETSDSQPEGVKKFTPQRKGNEPISEIGNRLDEFFDLDEDQEEPVEKKNKTIKVVETQAIKPDKLSEPEAVEAPMPEDEPSRMESESVEKPLSEGLPPQVEVESVEEPLPFDSDHDILKRLKSSVESQEWFKNELSMIAISQDISYLNKQWENDPDKICLLQIIDVTVNLYKKQFAICQQKNEDKVNEESKDASFSPQTGHEGVWGKIKGLLTF